MGTVPEGGACGLGNLGSFSAECAGDLVCVTEGMCPGRCSVAGANGGSSSGLLCAEVDGEPICVPDR